MPDVFGQLLDHAADPPPRRHRLFWSHHKMVTWNDTNPWRKHTFWWQSPDGSRVLAVVPPTHFIGSLEPDHLAENCAISAINPPSAKACTITVGATAAPS
jgi:hypothetical protein